MFFALGRVNAFSFSIYMSPLLNCEICEGRFTMFSVMFTMFSLRADLERNVGLSIIETVAGNGSFLNPSKCHIFTYYTLSSGQKLF